MSSYKAQAVISSCRKVSYLTLEDNDLSNHHWYAGKIVAVAWIFSIFSDGKSLDCIAPPIPTGLTGVSKTLLGLIMLTGQ